MAPVSVLHVQETSASRQSVQPSDTIAVVRHLSHELRQPLSTIETSAYYLKLILPKSDARVAHQLDKMEQMVHQMSWILSDAVHYLQAAPPRPEWVDLCELISEPLVAEAMEDRVELDWKESPAPVLVHLDPAQAGHLVRTIVSVFRQLASSGRPVKLSFYRDGDQAALECACEVAQPLCDRTEDLFQAFTPHLPAGSGLSLASVRRIAEAHGGSARLSCENGVLKLEILLPAG
ncbi:MAG: HAMP domain-containing histidine kinase [Acidobacteria bacterium]|nr:HAMP domain-containing histidine kinase [Acidobacteriota bacterium]